VTLSFANPPAGTLVSITIVAALAEVAGMAAAAIAAATPNLIDFMAVP
jgi:hypothetical protein